MTSVFHRRFRTVILAITALAAFSAPAVAQMLQPPLQPLQFTGRVTPGTVGVSFSWMRNQQGGHAQKFIVYHATGQENTMGKFSRVGTITPATDSMFTERNGLCTWFLPWNFQTGVHTFFVTSWNEVAESSPSNFIYLALQNAQTTLLRFTSQPPSNELVIGETFSYTPSVQLSTDNGITWTSDVAGLVTFSLQLSYDIMENATIDPATGRMVWTANRPGVFGALIKVIRNGETAVGNAQFFTLEVPKCANLATVSGTVTDKATGKQVTSGYVLFMPKSANPNGIPDTFHYGTAITGPDGSYQVHLDEGEYFALASAQGYNSEYFMDSPDLAGATTITVGCGQVYTAHFTLTKTAVPNFFRVSGQVLDKETGTPVTPSVVTFISKSIAAPGTNILRQTAWTDQNGNYSILLPEKQTYIAYAEGYSRDSLNTGGSQYLVCYYDGADEPTNATGITLTADRDDVNFGLKRRPYYQNGISGILSDSAGHGLNGNVIAYRILQNTVNGSRWVATAQNGVFSMQNLIPGEYVLFGFAATRQFTAPGFYVQGGLSTLDWSKATRITVQETGTVSNIAFRLQGFTLSGGRGGIRGTCSSTGGGIKTGENPLGAKPLAGAVVYVLDSKNSIKDYAFSDNDGKYDISTLKPGTYTLSASRVGFAVSTEQVSVTDENTTVERNIDLKPNSSATGVEESAVQHVAVFPNPMTGNAFTAVVSTSGAAGTISLVNAVGITVYVVSTPETAGTHYLMIPTETLPAGVYSLRVGGTATPVVIVR